MAPTLRSAVLAVAHAALVVFAIGALPAQALEYANAVDADGLHTCAILEPTGVKCWGWNIDGQLGDGTRTDRRTPVAVAGITGRAGAVTTGARHSCALLADGVKCWGDNAWGQLGDGTFEDRLTPVAVVGLGTDVVAIAAGDSHTCALTVAGTLKCWGNNSSGQVGDGTLVDRNLPVAITAAGSGLLGVSMGWYHTCVVTNPGGLRCWGSNAFGQLGTSEAGERATPGDVPGLTGVLSVSLGGEHSCAIASGAVKCWGRNDYGQLGDGLLIDRSTPRTVAGLGSGAATIAAGWGHSCAVMANGTVKCWGDNSNGQLGDGTGQGVRVYPVDVPGLTRVTALAIGPFHMCAFKPNTPIVCWGANNQGQVGDGSATLTQKSPTPVSGDLFAASQPRRLVFTPPSLVFGPQAVGTASAGQALTLTNIGDSQSSPMQPMGIAGNDFQIVSSTCGIVLAVNASCTLVVSFVPTAAGLRPGTLVTTASEADAAVLAGTGFAAASPGSGIAAIKGGSAHTCALTSAGGMKCWGFGAEGQLGDGTSTRRLAPVDVLGLGSGVATISTLGGSTCALTTGGGAKCWGSNVEGQLGDGSITNRASPTDVATLGSGVASLAASYLHGCAVTTTGGVQCWGHNGFGQLGNPSPARQATPTAVTLLGASISSVFTGPFHSCAITTVSGRVKCWGNNAQGQLGNGVAEVGGTPVPQDVEGLPFGKYVTALATGHSHTCALNHDGAVKCWGDNIYGQLGDGTGIDRLQPVDVVGLQSGVVAIAASSYHTCALTATGAVKCWGSNDEGQLGNGTRVDSLVPVDVGVAGAVAIGTGQYHSCAAFADGARCWGLNTHGQLGDGTQERRLVPTAVAFPVPDTTPEAFAFASRTGVALFSLQTSDPVTPAGYDTPAPISVANGLYSIGCVAYTNVPGTISPGQSVCVQHNAAATSGASMTTTLTIGGVTGAFTTSTGSGPALSLTPASLDFGNQSIGTTSAGLTATLTNTGGSNASFLPPSVTGDFTIASLTCGSSLAPGASCTITISFTPSALGARGGTLTVANFINPAASALTGTGLTASPAVLSFSPVSLAFGSQPVGTTSAPLVVTFSNTGGSAAALNPVSPPQATAEYAVASTTCGTSLPANASCTLTITFTPAAMGLRNGTFVVFTEFGVRAGALTGTGVPASAIPGAVVMIASGNSHTCALTAAGGVKCWGSNLLGQLGDATTTNSSTPVDVVGLASGVASITAGSQHTCALTTAGGVKCWGSNFVGALGDGSNIVRNAPVDVVGLASGVAAVDAGGTHTCALMNSGGVKCWGWNAYGQLGDATETNRNAPGDVVGLTSGVAAIAGGGDHTCAITSGGALKCWGSNGSAQLGFGLYTVLQSTPVDVPGMQFGTIAITAGLYHTCALTAAGGLKCWGDNTQGNLGDGTDASTQPLPVDVAGLSSGVASVSAGGQLTCAVTSPGGVKCWGSGSSGQLGDGSTTNRNAPVDVLGIASGALAVAPGAAHTCALLANGSVKCWGSNFVGQLGDGTLDDRLVPGPVVVGLAGGASDTTPDAFTFPSRTGVVLFGPQVSDPLVPTGYDAPAPITIANGTYSIGCGFSGTYTSAAGTINPGQSVCVQHNAAAANATSVTTTLTIGGVAGTFTTTTMGGAVLSLSPPSLDFGNRVVGTTTALTATLANTGQGNASFLPPTVSGTFSISSTTCGLSLAAGTSCTITVAFTPAGTGAQVGTLTVANFINPVATALTGTGVAPSPGDIARVVSGDNHTCALTFGGGVKCWGDNGGGQLGDNSSEQRLLPVAVAGLASGVAAIGAGTNHTCALTTAGGMKCWGSNTVGQIGDNSTTNRHTPVDVPGLTSGVAAIAVGGAHTCALTTGGGVKCWGNNFNGGLGDNTKTDRGTPVDVVGLSSGVAAIAAGNLHTCALLSTGGVKCWGFNNAGQVGDGSSVDRLVPVDVTGLASGVAAIELGFIHTCALTTGGGAKCWGGNGTGQLGDGSIILRRVPVDVSGLSSGVASIATGGSHTCAVTIFGAVKCWGANTHGQLGDGSTTERHVPGDVPSLASGVTAISAGSFHTCAVPPGSGVKCWGGNFSGQLGDGTFTNRFVPTEVVGVVSVDSTPDPFAFPTRTGVAIGPQFSDPVTPTGYDLPAPISVANGTYSIGCGFTQSYTAAPGTINPGQSVCVQHTAALTPGTSVTTTLTIGGVSGTFTTTTLQAAVLSLSPVSLDFGSQRIGTTSAGQVVTLTNSGAGSATFIASTSGDFAVASQTCGSTIAANSSCTFTLVFTPTELGLRSSAFGVLSGTAYTVPLSGTGTREPQAIVFGVLLDRGVGTQFTVRATTSSGLPVTFSSLTPAVCTVAGATVALVTSGTCSVAADQAGNSSFAPAPRQVQAFRVGPGNPGDVVAITTGSEHACALTVAGGVKCWGANTFGQLGDGSTIDRPTPVDVIGLQSGVAAIAAGGGFTCALHASGSVQCWGGNFAGQLGDGTNTSRTSPTTFVNIPGGRVAIAAGGAHACALTTGGQVYCWGRNSDGQLGSDGTNDNNRPVRVFGFEQGVAIAAGSDYTCAITAGGAAQCWGDNFAGKLGREGTGSQLYHPADVTNLASGAATIAPGWSHSCAATTGGAAKCWGDNFAGQVGDGSITQRRAPVDVVGLGGGVAGISAGFAHACAVTTAGAAKCWGDNRSGALGDGSTSNRLTPGDVEGLGTGTVSIAAELVYTCALTARGGVLCWGDNSKGQLGDGSTTNRLTPGAVFGLSGLDTTPDVFGNHSQSNVRIGSTRMFLTSVPGFYDPAPISIAGGEYSIGCANAGFTTAPGILEPGVDICVRHVAAAGYSQSFTTTVTIGGVAGTFRSTTAPAPQPTLSTASLSFGNQPVGTASAGRIVSVTNPSAVHEVLGLGAGVTGEFLIVATTCSATLAPGASCSFTVTFTPLSQGGRADELLVYSDNGAPPLLRVLLTGTGTFSDTTPSTFTFVDQFLVPTNTVATSAPVQIVGISAFALVNVIGGSYAISSGNNCSGDVLGFGTRPGSVLPNQFICVRHTTSAVPGGSNDTQLIVGGMGDTFTTVTADPVPSPFAMGSQSGVGPSSVRVSTAVPITGINTSSPFSVANGQVSVNCTGSFASSGTLDPGSTLCARQTAAAGFGQSNTTTVTVGGVSSSFVTTTFTAEGDADNDGIPNAIEYYESRNPELKDNDVFGNARLFAMQQYRDFLGREGDVGGIQFYVDLLNGGTATRVQVIESFLASQEFQNGLPSMIRLYFSFFNRIPDYGGLNFQVDAFRSGTPLEVIAQNFYNSPEFTTRYGALTNDQYIHLVYQNVLGRAPDPGGYDFYKTRLDSGVLTKGQMMIGFSESPEFQQITAHEVFTVSVYVGLLQRTPEPAGLDFYVDLLDSGTPRSAIIPGFFNSPEYHGRFLP